jgi:hypothetical protein
MRRPLDRVAQVPPTWAVALRGVLAGPSPDRRPIRRRGHACNTGMRELGASPSEYDASTLEIVVCSEATIEVVCGRDGLEDEGGAPD